MGAQGNWPNRHTRHAAMGARITKDTVRQDHAPDIAQDRSQRLLKPGRYVNAGGTGGRTITDR